MIIASMQAQSMAAAMRLQPGDEQDYLSALRRLNHAYAADRPALFSTEARLVIREVFVAAQQLVWQREAPDVIYLAAVEQHYRDDDCLRDLLTALPSSGPVRGCLLRLDTADSAVLKEALTSPAIIALLAQWDAKREGHGVREALVAMPALLRDAVRPPLDAAVVALRTAAEQQRDPDVRTGQRADGVRMTGAGRGEWFNAGERAALFKLIKASKDRGGSTAFSLPDDVDDWVVLNEFLALCVMTPLMPPPAMHYELGQAERGYFQSALLKPAVAAELRRVERRTACGEATGPIYAALSMIGEFDCRQAILDNLFAPTDVLKPLHAIRCTTEAGAAWSTERGWVDNDGYDLFTAAERELLTLPIEGAWCTVAEMKSEQQRVAAEVGTDAPGMGA